MQASTTVVYQTNKFVLIKHAKTKHSKSFYTVGVTNGHLIWSKIPISEYRSHFDPAGNRRSTSGHKWKFKNRKDAEQLMTLALIKWSYQ